MNKNLSHPVYKNDGQLEMQELEYGLISILVIEHIFSYLTGYFRKWEINNYG
jgi:hypothetical protein